MLYIFFKLALAETVSISFWRVNKHKKKLTKRLLNSISVFIQNFLVLKTCVSQFSLNGTELKTFICSEGTKNNR